MKIIEVTVNKGRTFNLGNYASARYDYGLTAKLDANDDVGEVVERLQTDVDKLVEDETEFWEKKIQDRNGR